MHDRTRTIRIFGVLLLVGLLAACGSSADTGSAANDSGAGDDGGADSAGAGSAPAPAEGEAVEEPTDATVVRAEVTAGYEGPAYPVPADPLPGPDVNSVMVTLLDSQGHEIGSDRLDAGEPVAIRVPDSDPEAVEIAWSEGVTARGDRQDFWRIPEFVGLGEVDLAAAGLDVALVDSGLYYHLNEGDPDRYDNPNRPGYAAVAAGTRAFLACDREVWNVGSHKFTVDLIADGVYADDRELIDRGAQGIDWVLDNAVLRDDAVFELTRECDGRTIEDFGLTHHTSQWLEAVGRATFLLASSSYAGEFRPRIDEYIAHVETMSTLLDDDETRRILDTWAPDDGNAFSEKLYMRAAAKAFAASLTSEPSNTGTWSQEAAAFAEKALDEQWSNGVNPTRGGFDVRYQMSGTWNAVMYDSVLPDGELEERLKAAIDRALEWMSGRVDDTTGRVDIAGSERTCDELEPTATANTPTATYHPYTAVSVFLLWGHLQDEPRWVQRAVLVDEGHKTTGNPCP